MGGGELSFRERLLELADEHEQLRERCDTITNEGEQLRLKLEAAQSAPAASEALESENRELKARLESLSEEAAEVKDLRAQVTAASESAVQCDLFKAENLEMKAKLAKIEEEAPEMEAKLAQRAAACESDAKLAKSEAKELRKKIKAFEEMAAQNRTARDTLAAENDELKTKVETLESAKAPMDDLFSLPLLLSDGLTSLTEPVDSLLKLNKPLEAPTLSEALEKGDRDANGKEEKRDTNGKEGKSKIEIRIKSKRKSVESGTPTAEELGSDNKTKASPAEVSTLAVIEEPGAPKTQDDKKASQKDADEKQQKKRRSKSSRSKSGSDGDDGKKSCSSYSSHSSSRSSSAGKRSGGSDKSRSPSRKRRRGRREDKRKDREGGGRRRKTEGGGRRRRKKRGRRRRSCQSGGSGSRSRSDYSRSRSRSNSGGGGGRPTPRRGGGSGGKFGCGNHRTDLEGFITKNQLEARVAHALRSMQESDQKKVMGTDGGENSYMLIDRVKNPNGVVMSRIRKLESGR